MKTLVIGLFALTTVSTVFAKADVYNYKCTMQVTYDNNGLLYEEDLDLIVKHTTNLNSEGCSVGEIELLNSPNSILDKSLNDNQYTLTTGAGLVYDSSLVGKSKKCNGAPTLFGISVYLEASQPKQTLINLSTRISIGQPLIYLRAVTKKEHHEASNNNTTIMIGSSKFEEHIFSLDCSLVNTKLTK